MPDWGNCLLVCINLTELVKNPYNLLAEFDYKKFADVIGAAVYFANVVSIENRNRHPYKQQQDMDHFSRRIGIEITGLADVFAMLGYNFYGNEDSAEFTSELCAFKLLCELYYSSEFTKHFGVCPVFSDPTNIHSFVTSEFYRNLQNDVKKIGFDEYFDIVQKISGLKSFEDLTHKIITNKLANSAFSTIGPCGSVSIIANNCTTGIEPLFAYEYTRKVSVDGKLREFTYKHYLSELKGGAKNKYQYAEAHNISYLDRVRVQARAQKYTDTSISSTINLSENTDAYQIKDIYLDAWKSGLKGITIFRDGCKTGVLSTNNSTEVEKGKGKEPQTPLMDDSLIKRSLLDIEEAERYRVVWKRGKVYVIVSLDNNDKPIEIFAKLPRQAGFNKDNIFEQDKYNENVANWDCINRLISIMLRYNIPLKDIIEQLDKSSCSLVDAPGVIRRILLNYLENDNEDLSELTEPIESDYSGADPDETFIKNKNKTPCPSCGSTELYHREGGCFTCSGCGYSKCD